jgi:anaerobic selenocysteine-containing dehydrogenase
MVKTSGTFCVSRRAVLKTSAATGAALAAGSVFAPAVHAARASASAMSALRPGRSRHSAKLIISSFPISSTP